MINGIFLANANAGGMGLISMLVWIVVMVAAMYFLIMRPQKKRQREHDVLMSELANGDSILTTSGFYGVVIDIMDEIVIVEFGNNKNCRIPMKKDAIVEIEKAEKK